jgi:hypothetical protein
MCCSPGDRALIVGGWGGTSGSDWSSVDSAEIYDRATNTWKLLDFLSLEP